jgi:hypothetical protein
VDAGHEVQLVEPSAVLKKPLGHSAQELLPITGLNLPTSQGAQASLPAAEKRPTGQLTQEAFPAIGW